MTDHAYLKEIIVADDKQPTEVEAEKNRDEIVRMDATRPNARGNVHSEPDDTAADDDAPPPPLPH